MNTKRQKQNYYRLARKQKKCTACRTPVSTNHSECPACRKKRKLRKELRVQAGLCVRCGKGKVKITKHCKNCLEKARQQKIKLKLEVFKAYGGCKCNCECGCKIKHHAFLSIDHVNGKGCKHRKSLGIKSGIQFYQWLKKNKYPKGYQVLCHNCNIGKHINKGICPLIKIKPIKNNG